VYRNENRHTCIHLGLKGHQTVMDGGKLIVTRIQKSETNVGSPHDVAKNSKENVVFLYWQVHDMAKW